MNIIFGRDQAALLGKTYTVLELDTIRIAKDGPEITAFCVVDSIPILQMHKVTEMEELHQNLLVEYRKQNWNYCNQALEHLVGFWGQDMDTFYENLKTRIDEFEHNEPGPEWNGIIEKIVQ